jgi:hypothetical protein
LDLERIKKEVNVINSILKFAKTNNASKQGDKSEDICDQALFVKVVKTISAMIDSKHFDAMTSTTQQAAFMFKEDFRTVISTLFTLFEYKTSHILFRTGDGEDFFSAAL